MKLGSWAGMEKMKIWFVRSPDVEIHCKLSADNRNYTISKACDAYFS